MAAALVATVLIAALLASLFFAVNEETRTGAAVVRRDRALAAAESAIEMRLGELVVVPVETPVGAVDASSLEVDGLPVAIHTTRLDSTLFWIVAVVGAASDPGAARHRIGVFATASRAASDSIAIVRLIERPWSELY
ncbi:MAG TPA: hypothetical protein VNO75_01730 [Gemmatimonadaceae bacterium]|nr:hypothetical protein [Gemmatimonadaceae bacterium]